MSTDSGSLAEIVESDDTDENNSDLSDWPELYTNNVL